MDSWRMVFIDIDQSYNIPVADSAIQGYMVCRAPKGSTEAVYFSKGSTNQIKAMLGIPTADWPDIQDALDLNATYGLWVSAPPGASASYPSYYGGTYITSQGLFPFYNVTDRTSPSFQVLVDPTQEDDEFIHAQVGNSLAPVVNSVVAAPSANVASSTTPYGPSYLNEISITSVPAAILNSLVGVEFNFWGNKNATTYNTPATYVLGVTGTHLTVTNPGTTATINIGSISGSTSTILLGNPISGYNTSAFATQPLFFDFEQLVSSAPYRAGGVAGAAWNTSGAMTRNAYLAVLGAALASTFKWIVDVTDTTYMTIAQKTQTEKETSITIKDIGYDKYAYDLALDTYVWTTPTAYGYAWTYTPGASGAPYPTAADVENTNGLYVQFYTSTQATTHPECVTGIYQSAGNNAPPINVTANYKNRYIRIVAPGILRVVGTSPNFVPGTIANPPCDITNAPAYVGSIYYVDSTGTLQLCLTTGAPTGTYPARIAANYNQITFSVIEDVYPGDATSGGTFTGSLSQTGTDGYGGNIYFPNVLPENALSDVDIAIYKTFDDDVSTDGFYTDYRIIDPRNYYAGVQQPSTVVTTAVGQRYVTSVVNSLIAAGSTGGVIDARFTPLLIDGWTEAGKGVYEPCPVFAEPTGTEDLKEILYDLRLNTHKVATFVTARMLSASEVNDPSSIIVTGRLTGTSQLVNQTLRSDTFTGAKYWTNLVGAYAAELLYIIDGKLGGWAPMWTNVSGFGGQLPIAVNKMKYEFTQDQLQALDTIGLNPIVLDSTYGLTVVSQKTTQSPDNLSDWSYLGHSMAFDLFKREVRDDVMVPQIGKPNDPYYQAMRQRQVEAILNRRIGGAEPIWAAGKVEVANVNTDDVKAQRKFAIRVSVKVNIFSEYVELTFINVAQQTQI
jgi:hypothetical protein